MTQSMTQQAEDLKARKVELVLQQLDSLPTLPAIAMRLLALTGNTETNIKEVTDLISADPALASKVVSLAQSAGLGASHPLTSIQQAILRLGFDAIRGIVLAVKVLEVFQPEQPGREGSGFDRADFWKHSLAVATVAEMLAPKLPQKISPQEAFLCGLLHDMGKIAFDTVMPKSFERAAEVAGLTRGDIADAERRIIGLDHAVAGKRLAEAWNLPTVVIQAIWLHGTAPTNIPQGMVNPALVQLIGLADMLVRRQHIGFSGNYSFPYETSQYLQPLGLQDADVAAVRERLTENMEARAKVLGLYDMHSRQLYLESIANANAELGRVNQALAIQNRKLAARSQCFDMITRFYNRIVPAATPAQLLLEVANVAHEFLAPAPPGAAARIVLFSHDPDQVIGEVLLFDSAARLNESFLMQMPKALGDQRVGRSTGFPVVDPIRPASPQLDWLLERVKDFIGVQRCWYFPLVCGGETVGGLVWAAGGDNPPVSGFADLGLVGQAWGMTVRMAQVREQQNVLTETLAGSNRELGALQHQLVRARALAGLGEMAAAAAHEMNNPLAVVCGRAQLLASKLNDSALKQDAMLIAQQGQRLSQIITDLMEFARPVPPKLARHNMLEIVQSAVAIAAERSAERKVSVRIESSNDVPEIQADAPQVRAAIAEVVLNAMQATPAKDSDETAANRPAPEVLVQLRFDTLDRQLIVQVTDHGLGMHEDVARQAFAPFFSVKSAGRQRGMGLAKALRWVEAHGGTIRLDTAPLSGTTAVIILPTDGPASENKKLVEFPEKSVPLPTPVTQASTFSSR